MVREGQKTVGCGEFDATPGQSVGRSSKMDETEQGKVFDDLIVTVAYSFNSKPVTNVTGYECAFPFYVSYSCFIV